MVKNNPIVKEIEERGDKILVLGHARHGKDTVADLLGNTLNASKFCLQEFLYDRLQAYMKRRGLGPYQGMEHAYQDRVWEREKWFYEIQQYNAINPARLAKKLLEVSNIYVGVRCARELAACIEQNLFTHILWVDASERLPPEPTSSMTISFDPSVMRLISNNGAEADLPDIIRQNLNY